MFENISISNKLPKWFSIKINKVRNSWLPHYKIAEFSVFKEGVKVIDSVQMYTKVIKMYETGDVEKIQIVQSSLSNFLLEKLQS